MSGPIWRQMPEKTNMATTKHTPGPWRAIAGAYGPRVETDQGIIIAKLNWRETLRGGEYDEGEQEGQHEANADLIASAPELLAALERFVAFASKTPSQNLQGIVDQANQAISKAKGTQ